MDAKTLRINTANQTLKAFNDGFYELDGLKIDVSKAHKNSLENTTLYTPDMLDNIHIDSQNTYNNKKYSLLALPVVSALVKLNSEGKANIGILNFASAKNAGGGFLNGALAQEESIAMCSNLYLTQIKNEEYYNANRSCGTMLYTDHMIYSKDVVFIRENTDIAFEKPIIASVLTAPAVNMGQYIGKGGTDIAYAQEVMKNRMRKVLQVFAKQKNDIIVLGAYGCGVFRNDPKVIATFFIDLLKDEGLEKYFSEIVFAVFDSSKTKDVYKTFEKVFK